MKKKLITVKGQKVEVQVLKTEQGDFIGVANWLGSEARGICRYANREVARKQCVERLFNHCMAYLPN